jgi:arsenate reductase
MSNSNVRIYHNPGCSKSREALALLRARGIEPEIVLYLERGLSAEEVEGLAVRLGTAAQALVRSKEALYESSGLTQGSDLAATARAIARAPILLERPIVVVGERAVIGRPPERVLDLL